MAVVFVKAGQEVHFTGGSLTEAVNEGVRQGYVEGFLRKSVVQDPIDRVNTGDNTPAVLHYEIVEGDQVEITVAPKGFGSENMSRVFMPVSYTHLPAHTHSMPPLRSGLWGRWRSPRSTYSRCIRRWSQRG